MSCPVKWLLVTKTVEYNRRPCTGDFFKKPVELVELLLLHRERFEFGLSTRSFKVLLFLQKTRRAAVSYCFEGNVFVIIGVE